VEVLCSVRYVFLPLIVPQITAKGDDEKDIRSLYNALLRVVKQMIGSDIISQEELGSSMYVVYHVINNQEKTETQKRYKKK